MMSQLSEALHSAVAGGTADALTVTYTNTPSALTDGMTIRVRATASNATTTPTLNVNSLGAKTITKFGGTALAVGDIGGNLYECVFTYNLANTRWELLNPKASASFTGGTLTSTTAMSGAAFNEAFTTLASASTVNIGAAAANYIQITGTTTITAFDTVQAGTERVLEFAGILTLTHNATSLILPNNGSNMTTAAGDVATFRSEGSGNWRCTSYQTQQATTTTTVPNGGTGRTTLTNHGLLVGAGTAAITQLADATNGQIPIGSTGVDPVLATITAGTGISVTNGAGSITIAATGSGVVGTLTAGTTNTLNPIAAQTVNIQAHGLGATPALVIAWLECISGDGHYATGDRVSLGAIAEPATAPASDSGISVIYNATNTYISLPAGLPEIPDKTSKATLVTPTASKWKAVCIPYIIN